MEILKPGAEKLTLPRLLKWIVLLILGLGILFRFSHLDRKVYWHDEVFTSMEATAHGGSELKAEQFIGEEITPSTLLIYQRIDPERTLSDLVFRLGSEDPQHPPLFYLLLHGWMRLWGDSIVVTRSLAALFSLLVFPGMYWLCWELFRSPRVGWVAIALLAISPIHLVYAQEAREYSLLTALTLLSSAALLRAIRLKRWWHWALYGLTLILAFYTAVFSALVALGHGIYVLSMQVISIQSWRDGNSSPGASITLGSSFFLKPQISCTRRVREIWDFRNNNEGIAIRETVLFLITGAIAVIAFIPWLYFLTTYSDVVKATTHWITISLSLPITFKLWMVNLSRVFLDQDVNPFAIALSFHWLVIIPIVGLELYAFYFLVKKAPKSSWLFILALLAGTSLPLIIPDIVLGGQRSTVTRYFLPFFLCLDIAVAYLIVQLGLTAKRTYQSIAILLSALLAIAGILSCRMYLQSGTWWNKLMSYHHPVIAQMLNGSDRPLLITDAYGYNPANLVSLSYLLHDTVTVLPLPEFGISPEIPVLPDLSHPIFLLNLPDPFRDKFETQYGGKFQLAIGELWRWQPPNP